MADKARVPITIITGFLGSGKTTLILNLIPQLRTTNPDYKLALVKNEFGDVAVDSQLAASSAISGVQELLGGCVCCNLVGKLDDAIEELRRTIHPDRIIIETSGSAYPATLVFQLNRLIKNTGSYMLDGVVSVIDVENWEGYEETTYTARVQARYTDLIVFNKWELCDERRFDIVLDKKSAIDDDGHEIPWVKSDKGRVPADVVFGIDGGLAKTLTGENGCVSEHNHEHDHEHQTEVEVLSITLKGPKGAAVDSTKLMTLLKEAPKPEVYRIKSVLTASSTVRNSGEDESLPKPPHPAQRYILNWAFGRWTFTLLSADASEHGSSDEIPLRMTMILARYESTQWKNKLENGKFLELDESEKGELSVLRML